MEQDQNKLSWPIRTALFIYRRGLSPILESTQRTLTGHTGACRFQPTCSDYAELSFQLHGPARGSLLTLRRLSRCHPFARGGFDPVPARDGSPAPIPEKNEPLEPTGATGHLP